MGKEEEEPTFEELLEQLKDKDSEIRKKAAIELGDSRKIEAVEPLIESLDDEDAYVRIKVVKALGKIGDVRALYPLIKEARKRKDYEKNLIIETWGEFNNKKAVKPLVDLLKDKSGEMRLGAIEALMRLRDEKSFKPLKKELLKFLQSSNDMIRGYSIIYLLELDDETVLNPILEALQTVNGEMQWSALEILLNNDLFKNITEMKRIELIVKIGGMIYENEPKDGMTPALFLKIGTKAIEPLIQALESEDRWTREMAIRALGELKDERAISHLIKALHAENIHERG